MKTETPNNPEGLLIKAGLFVPFSEIEFKAVRSQGPGGQSVNKVNTAVQISFDVKASSLPERIKRKLLSNSDKRLSTEGVYTIKGQGHRSQMRNKEAALQRLAGLIREAAHIPKVRKPTKPSFSARQKRMDSKTKRSKTKSMRGRVKDTD